MKNDQDSKMLLFRAHQAQGRRLGLYNASILLFALAALAAPVIVAVYAIEQDYAWQVVGGLVVMTFTGATGLLLGITAVTYAIARIVEVRSNSQALRLIGSPERVEQPQSERTGEAPLSDVGEHIEPDGFDRDSAATTPESARAGTSEIDADGLRSEWPGRALRTEGDSSLPN